MSFKIGDKVIIHDGSWSILIKGTNYNTFGIREIDKVTGTVIATDCRLPIGPSCTGENPTPMEGMSYGGEVMFHDLLVQTEDGFVFTSTRHVRLVEPGSVKLVLCGVEIAITEQQYNDLEAREFFSGYYFIKGA